MATDARARFSNRVGDYVRYRPNYPPALFEALGLGPGVVAADVGAGTGISSRALLATGATVVAVEPNAAMRAAIGGGVRALDGSAEATGLPDASVDLVTAFQAFHWFDRAAARREFARILKPGGRVALVWNDRDATSTPFLRGYEALLREFAGDYLAVRHNGIEESDLATWFGGTMHVASFPNGQSFDFEGLLGRLMSSSYAPSADHPRHTAMVEALRRLFDETQQDGLVEMRYEARVHYGPLG